MHEAGWDLTWARPITLVLVPDHADELGLSIRQGSTGVVQIALGARVRLSITTGTETRDVDGHQTPVDVIHGVLAIHRDDVDLAPDESNLDFDFDEMALTADGARPASPLVSPSLQMPALEPDFDKTTPTPPPSDPPFAFIDLADRSGRMIHRIDGTTLVGRAPHDRDRDAGDSGDGVREGAAAALLTVSSVTDHVSATHLSLTPSGGHLVVRDLASTNGTTVIPIDGEPYPLTPREPVIVAPGTRLVLTADVTITVVADPAGDAVPGVAGVF